MVGILLMTHAPLGQAFIAAVAHVFRGPTERFEAIDVVADQDLAEVQELARKAICRLDDGSGVLADAGRVEVIAGISLPMLLRAITYRRDTLDVVVEMALAGAHNGAVRVDNRIKVG